MFTALIIQLKGILGTESGGSWMHFMQTVEDQLPLMDQPGRPTLAQIEESPIGQAGFTSWAEMIESKKGLGWSYNSWKAWKKAWGIVKKNPYLKQLRLTASEINTISRETEEFPASPEALAAHQANRKKTQAEQRANSVNALKTQLTAAQEEVQTRDAQLATLRLQAQEEKARFEAQQAASGKKIEELQRQLATVNAKADTLLTVQQKGIWQRIIWAISPV